MGNFKNYIEDKESNGGEASSASKEALREIQIVMNETIGQTQRVNGFGIDSIKFQVLNQEETESGIQVNLEASGSAIAKNEKHISRMLQKLVEATREQLWKKKIFLEMMYHKIDVSETKIDESNDDDDNPNVDLKRTLYFTVICAACAFN
jgi:hypothetical protein